MLLFQVLIGPETLDVAAGGGNLRIKETTTIELNCRKRERKRQKQDENRATCDHEMMKQLPFMFQSQQPYF